VQSRAPYRAQEAAAAEARHGAALADARAAAAAAAAQLEQARRAAAAAQVRPGTLLDLCQDRAQRRAPPALARNSNRGACRAPPHRLCKWRRQAGPK